MNNVLSIDIETKNLSHEIGGWGNTHMFKVACVASYDGTIRKIYTDDIDNENLGSLNDIEVKTLRELKYDLDDHFDKGGKLLGHNIIAFDLPVLRDSLDIFIAKKYLDNRVDMCIDTSAYISKNFGKRIHLDNLTKCTLNAGKSMDGVESVKKWREGDFNSVLEYCIKDVELTYDLWKHGKDKGIIKAFDVDKAEVITYPCFW